MAVLQQHTTSNRPAVSDADELRTILDGWSFIPHHGELTVEVHDGTLRIVGGCGFEPYPSDTVEHPDERYDQVDIDGFADAIGPYLKQPLKIHTISHEKHRFPFGMQVIVVGAETGDCIVKQGHDMEQSALNELDE